MSTRNSKGKRATLAAGMAAGARKHLGTGSQALRVGGVVTTLDGFAAKLQGIADVRAEVQAARATLQAKLDQELTEIPSNDAFLTASESFIRGIFTSADVLADFGLAPRKRPAPTAEAKAIAVAKRAATRAARHTMGPRQKAAVKGEVKASLVVTPEPPPSS